MNILGHAKINLLQMNLKLLILRVFLGIPFLTSCQNDLKKEENLRKEVMDLHDQVMPKMEEIYDLKTTLAKIEDTLSEDRRIEAVRKRKERLIQADDSMMNWMRNFKDPDKNQDHEFKMNYYLNEKKKMESVRMFMELSIDSAKQEINKIRNSK